MTKTKFENLKKEAQIAIQELTPQELMIYPKLMDFFNMLDAYKDLK